MSELIATCAITGKEFTISEQEQELRAKLELPLSKMCPLENMRALFAHRVAHGFWRNKSATTGQDFLAMYPKEVVFPVIDSEEWRSDQFVGTSYEQEIDWNRSLIEQYWELWVRVPRSHHAKVNCENCDFSNSMVDCNDCYYFFGGRNNENVYYSDACYYLRDCIDCYYVYNSELCYHCVTCQQQCYQCGYCQSCKGCADCLGCVDCQSCQNCLLCWGLRHQKFCYKNEPLSEEEYAAKLLEYKSDWERLKNEYTEIRGSHQLDTNLNIENSSGAYLTNCKDCRQCYNCSDDENVIHCVSMPNAKDVLNSSHGGGELELSANVCSSGVRGYRLVGCVYCYDQVRDLFYCNNCTLGVHDCLLSVSLNKREHHCILNKEYSEAEYEELRPRVIAKLIEEGWWGEPIPINWASNPYNCSHAYDFLPLTREEVESRGLVWAEAEDIVAVEGAEVAGDEIVTPEDVAKLNGKILKCERTGRPFRLIAAELSLYAKHGLPLPKLHPDERYRDRVKQTVSLESIFN